MLLIQMIYSVLTQIPFSLGLGQLLQSVSQTIFLFLLLLLAKGYTVTRARIGRTGTIVLLGFMFVYSVTTMALFAYKEMVKWYINV